MKLEGKPLAAVTITATATILTQPETEHVHITVVRRRNRWLAQTPPQPAPTLTTPTPPQLTGIPPKAQTDERWLTAVGFLQAWLQAADTSRWTTTRYTPTPPAHTYTNIQITTGSTPTQAPNTPDTQIFAIQYTATRTIETNTPNPNPRSYRIWLALQKDPTGRWAVTQITHRPPPPTT